MDGFMNILEEAIKLNVLVEQAAAKKLSELTESQKTVFLEKIKSEKPLIIDKQYIQKVFDETFSKKVSVQDFVAMLNEYFEAAKKLFPDLNPVSIRNCSENATIIGMVKKIAVEGNTTKIELEDTTGSIDVLCNQESASEIKEDDVIAVTGFVKNGVMKADKFQKPEGLEILKEKFPIIFKKQT